ncbi:MAG: DUF1700 domain-containing protein [Clostridia bacterium]|nr:DUF1700 domain-containing protein [Clostridia bacterium]
MNKQTFIEELKKALSGIPDKEADECVAFYGEMIDDRVEEGVSEERAVAEVGPIDDIVSQTIADIPLSKLVKAKMPKKRALRAWEIVLIVLGFPLWFPLLVAAGAVVLSIYIVVWAVIASLWAVEISLGACALGGIAVTFAYLFSGYGTAGLAMFGVGVFFAGVTILAFFGCAAATKGIFRLTKKAAVGIKKMFMKKEAVK